MIKFSRKRFLQTITGLAATLLIGASSAQASRDIFPIDPPQPVPNDGTIEVLEFFSYGCSHCANLEPALEAWEKKLPADVKFRRVPSGFNMMGIDEVSLFYTLETMGQLDRLHKKIFEAIHNDRVILGSKPVLVKWLEKNGVDPAKFESIEKSFSVQTKVTRGKQMAGLYKISSTPTLVINGRIGAVQSGGATAFLSTVDRLIEEARQANAPKAAAGGPAKAPAAAKPAAKPTPPAAK